MHARDRMTREIYTVESDARLDEVHKVMAAMGIRHLPVVEGRRLVGVLSDRDILLWSTRTEEGMAVPAVPVGRVMTREVEVCHEMAPLATLAAKMVEKKIDCLPVVKDEQLLGIVTSTDLLELMCNGVPHTAKQVIPITFRLKSWRRSDGDGPEYA